jgi:hypothetical protein
VIAAGGAAVLAFLLLQLLFLPLWEKQKRLESSIKAKEGELLELKSLVAQYKRLKAQGATSRGRRQDGPFNLFSILERIATQGQLMDKIDYMRPGTLKLDKTREEKWVELKLSRITLKELTGYLHKLQSVGEGIYIKRLSARKDGDYLNMILQPAVVELK